MNVDFSIMVGLWDAVLLNEDIFYRCGGAARQPQRTEPFQCVSGHPWECHSVLQGQMQPLQCAAGVVGPVLGAAAGLGRW